MRDNISEKQVKWLLAGSVSDDTPQVGAVIDRQGFESVGFIILTGSLGDADATFAVLLEESDASGSGFGPVADADMISQAPGTAPEAAASFQYDDDSEARKLGYIGTKRYPKASQTMPRA